MILPDKIDVSDVTTVSIMQEEPDINEIDVLVNEKIWLKILVTAGGTDFYVYATHDDDGFFFTDNGDTLEGIKKKAEAKGIECYEDILYRKKPHSNAMMLS